MKLHFVLRKIFSQAGFFAKGLDQKLVLFALVSKACTYSQNQLNFDCANNMFFCPVLSVNHSSWATNSLSFIKTAFKQDQDNLKIAENLAIINSL